MSNVTTGTTWVLDTVGVITNNPVWIQRIVFRPAAVDQVCKFTWYDLGNPVTAGTKSAKVGTITSTTTLTSAGNLPATILAGSVFEIIASNGSVANVSDLKVGGTKRRYRVATAGDTNAVIVEAKWTNEASITYCWTNYPTYTAMHLVVNHADYGPVTVDFHEPKKWLPNFVLDTLSAGAVEVYIG